MKGKIYIILFLLILLFPFPADAQLDNGVNEEWMKIESKYCTIFCHPDVNLGRVNRKIRIRFYDLDCSRNFANYESEEKQLAEKFDCIFQKAEKILDMYPRKIHLMVKIFKNQAQLDRAYKKTFGQENDTQRISYYVHKYTTIYTTQSAIRQGVLAHEIGHAVSDHYFLILPPVKIKELLAQYVEIHLEE